MRGDAKNFFSLVHFFAFLVSFIDDHDLIFVQLLYLCISSSSPSSFFLFSSSCSGKAIKAFSCRPFFLYTC